MGIRLAATGVFVVMTAIAYAAGIVTFFPILNQPWGYILAGFSPLMAGATLHSGYVLIKGGLLMEAILQNPEERL